LVKGRRDGGEWSKELMIWALEGISIMEGMKFGGFFEKSV